jgi:hypothetical protein
MPNYKPQSWSSQFSTLSPELRENCFVLALTAVRPMLKAIEAIMTSSTPMGCPMEESWARSSAALSASLQPKFMTFSFDKVLHIFRRLNPIRHLFYRTLLGLLNLLEIIPENFDSCPFKDATVRDPQVIAPPLP